MPGQPVKTTAKQLTDGDKVQIRAKRSAVTNKPVPKATSNNPKNTSKPKRTSRAKRVLKAPKKLMKKVVRRRKVQPSRADLINTESRLGSQIFGPVPAGHRREFFHDQQNVWIWHEAWMDENHHHHQLTVRYEARPSGVYKKLSAGKYVKLEGEELENFRKATHVYLHAIKKHLYSRA